MGELDETRMKLHFCTFLFFLSSLPLHLLLLLLLLLSLLDASHLLGLSLENHGLGLVD